MKAKNKIVLYTADEYGEFPAKREKVELYDFESLDHYIDPTTKRFYIRICCGGKFYYFPLALTSISSINIYNA